MTDDLRHLADLQDAIHSARGAHTGIDLAATCGKAAAVPTFGGDPTGLRVLAECCEDVAHTVGAALAAAGPLRRDGVSRVWAGDTRVGAGEALRVLCDDIGRAQSAFRRLAEQLRRHADHVREERRDAADAGSLGRVAATVEALTWGALPEQNDEGEVLRAQHVRASALIDDRVARHVAMRDAAEDFAAALHEIQAEARAGRLAGSPLSAVDEMVIAGAGRGGETAPRAPVLTPAMGARAAAALAALSDADRERLTGLLATALSAEHRAYLLKTLAAGHPVAEVARLDQLIAGHADDPAWLAERLSPLALDAERAVPGREPTAFGTARWAQGELPTCVAASTVTARAAVDPLYALGLTTGGRPGDPEFDSPAAFAARLRAEQVQVYDDGRGWFQETFGADGMTAGQSAEVGNAEIAPYTGARYTDVGLADAAARAAALTAIAHAVDAGYPVPFFAGEDGASHQLLVIGHAGAELQIYNPWGYTYWITEEEFVAGRIDGADPRIPSTPTSVRLPRAEG